MGKTLGYGEITVANMTEPFTVMLTNEAQQFATDSNRKVTSAQSYYTDIIVIRGSQERTDYTIGNITSGSGITVSKNSKRVTFSVSAGTTIGADAGVIEIPITLDGQTVKKQFSWSCGKQGPQGVKGDPGTSVKITSKSVTYQTSTSGTTAPTGTWSTTVPMVNNGQYLWTKTTVQYSDGNKTEAYSVSYKGTNGTNGTSVTVSKTEVTYQVSTSGTTAPTGTWSTTMPSCDQGQYLWTKTYVKYSDGKETTSYSVSYKGVDGEKFSWNLIQNGKGNEKRGFFKNFSSVNITEGYGEITLTSKHNYIGIGLSGFVLTPRQYEVGKKVTWSYDIMYTKWDFPTGTNHQEFWLGQRYTNAPSGETATGQWVGVTAHDLPVVGQNGCELNKWFHVEVTKTIPTQASSNVGHKEVITFYNSTDISATVTFRMKNVKLEYGDTATPWSPSQSDLEGRGVSQTVQYYLATSQASGVTSSTSGWSTDITTQKLTADKKYLWNCYQTKYSDGTSEPISTPKVIGVYGDKGQKGENAKNLSITPSSQYFKSTDGGKTFAPNTITIKPTIQGEINFGKWQYSIDGGVSFADAVSGQKGLTISNNVLTVSKDSSLYSDAVTMVTFRAVASDSSFYDTCSIAKIYDVSDIGDGRNLLTGVSSYTKDTPFEKTDSRADGWIVYQNIITSIELEAGKKYVLQAKTDGNWTANHDINGQDPSKKLVSLWLCSDTTNDFFDMRQGYVVFTPTVTAKYKLRVNQYSNGTDDYTIRLWDIKLEKGSSPTGWTPAPEDVQTAILSTKSEISDVSLKVDKNKQAIEQRVEKTTYQQDLNLVKGDISKANEGLNKWRYEIYPKSLFADKPEDQSKISLDVFARNKNIIPTQSILLDDTKLGYFNYDDNYIGYAVTFVKMSEATKLETTFVHDDAGSFYLNGKLICTNGTNNFYSSATPDTVSCTLVKGWNCLEVVINEGAGSEGFKFGTVLSQLSTCQLMNCYYAMVTGRESQITNTLVQNTIDIEGVSTKVGKVTSIIGENGENFTDFKNDYSDFKQTMNGFKATVGQTYVTKDDFNGLEIGGRNLLWNSGTTTAIQNSGEWNAHGCTATAETRNNCLVSRVNSPWNGYQFNLKKIIERYNLVDGDILTYSIDVKMDEPIDILFVNNYYADNKGCTGGISTVNLWDGKYFTIGKWERLSFTFKITQDTLDKIATDTYRQGVRTAFEPTKATSEGKYVYFACPKLERGTKATDYTPAPEDDEINGQNLVSNLPSNWEQGTFDGNRVDVGGVYNTGKVDNSTRIRVKELVPVSGTITISNAYSNQSKKPIQHVINAFDVNKKYLGSGYINTDWNDFPKIVDMKDAKYIAVIVKYKDNSAITPSDISQICLKIERGTSATPFTLAPEDVNGKIVNVETIANQTAKKFEWIVNGGDKSSSMVLTDDFLNIVANNINLTGKVTFNSLSSDAKNEIGKVAQSKVDGLDVGGRNLALQSKDFTSGEQYWSINSNFTRSVDSDGFTVLSIKRSGAGLEWNRAIPHNYIPVEEMHRGIIVSFDFMCDKVSELDRGCICALQIFNSGGGRIGWYESQDILSGIQCKLSEPLSDGKWIRVQVPFSEGDLKKTYGNSDAVAYASVSFNLVANGSIHFKKIKIEYGNKATDWTPAPEDVSQDATNKASQALTDAKNYSSNAVNWVANNGSSTTNLNSMVKKWTDGAVSDTAQINGGWIKANTITASKIAIGDFTNYCDDPYFENGMYTGGGTFTLSTEQKYYGTRSMKMCAGTNAYDSTRISQDFELQAGEKIYVEYYVYRNDANHNAGVGIYSGDSDYGAVVYDINGQVLASSNIANKTWTKVSYIATANRTGMWTACFKHGSDTALSGDWYLDNVTITRMTTGELIVDGSITADKIATDAIKSRNYISSGGTQGSFLNLGDGSFTSPNLSWDANGNLIAKNANLSGEITATKGSIGGWSVDNYSIYTTYDSDQNIFGSGISGTKGKYVLWAGETNNAIGANRSSDTPTDASLVIYNNGGLEVRKTMVGNDKKNHLYTTILQSGQINLKMDDNYIGTITATDTISSNSTVTMSHVSMAAKKGYGWSILHTDDSGNLISDIQRDPGDTKIKIRSPITVSSTDITKYNAIETTGDVVVNGKIHANYGPNRIQFNPDNNGSIELYGGMPFIDFHFACSNADYTSRIISQHDWDCLTFTGSILLGGTIYNSSGGHYTWDGKDDAYISCVNYSGGNNIYYYANYHAFYVNNDSGSGMMYINTNGVTSRVGFTKTSDERIKKNFKTFDDNIINAYMNIEPVKYQLKQSSNDKYHFGFKAQHIDKVFSDYGDAYNESFDICTSRPIDPDKAKELYGVDSMVEEYGLRYDELIAPTTYMVQHTYKELESTKDELAKIKQEKTDLETRLQAIEAKLGL